MALVLRAKKETKPNSKTGRSCHLCHNLNLSEEDRKWREIKDFSKSAVDGCIFCNIIVRAVKSFPSLWVPGELHIEDSKRAEPVIKLRFFRFLPSGTSQLMLQGYVSGDQVGARWALGLYTPKSTR
jgi:hypothetical protein